MSGSMSSPHCSANLAASRLATVSPSTCLWSLSCLFLCSPVRALASSIRRFLADFSGTACGGRIADSGSRILVTIDGYYRNGELVDHKAKADEAVKTAHVQGFDVEKVLVWRRYPGRTSPSHRWSRVGISSSTNCSRTTTGKSLSQFPCQPKPHCFSCTPAERLVNLRGASIAPEDIWHTLRARRSTIRISTPMTPTGASLTSGGSLGTPTSFTGPYHLGRRV